MTNWNRFPFKIYFESSRLEETIFKIATCNKDFMFLSKKDIWATLLRKHMFVNLKWYIK